MQTIIAIVILICLYLSVGSHRRSRKVSDYKKYLQTSHWRRRRVRALKRGGGKCCLCGSRNNLHVHHNSYANLWHEKDEDLTVLCAKCHAKYHGKYKGGKNNG